MQDFYCLFISVLAAEVQLSLSLGTIASLNEQNDSHSSIDMLLKCLRTGYILSENVLIPVAPV